MADIDALLKLESLFPSDQVSRRSFRRFIHSPSARVIVATRAERVVGNLILLLRSRSGRSRIYSMIVSPDTRGLGLGVSLIHAAMDASREAGRSIIGLEVRADNIAAKALYEKLGFQVTSHLPGFYDDGADGLRMERKL
ncbi:MAG: GNAT family N-acetyltransferase [Panacagrimonas sp.]